jgi:hypothetical protein
MQAGPRGDFTVDVPGVGAGVDYLYVIDGDRALPDPVSRWQPHGVHGPSRTVAADAFAWSDAAWTGLATMADHVVYELHVGTFTEAGTFDAIIPRLGALRARAHGGGQVLQERLGGVIDDGVHGVDAQRIDVKLVDPLQRVVDEKPADVVAVRSVEVERQTPRRLVPVGEVRAVLREVVPLGTEVVVDDVEYKGQPARVAGIDQALEAQRPTVRVLRRSDVRPVVAPVAAAGELRNRQQSDDGDPEVAQCVESRNDRFEGSLVGEGADVQLVDDVVLERDAAPPAVMPLEVLRHHFRRTVRPVRLQARGGIGPLVALDDEEIARTRAGIDDAFVIPAGVLRQCRAPILRRNDMELHAVGVRRPDPELAAVGRHEMGAQTRHCPLARVLRRGKRLAAGDGRGADVNGFGHRYTLTRRFAPPSPAHAGEGPGCPSPACGRRCREAADEGSSSLIRKTAPSGGSVSVTDHFLPCSGMGVASTPPMFPCPLPP